MCTQANTMEIWVRIALRLNLYICSAKYNSAEAVFHLKIAPVLFLYRAVSGVRHIYIGGSDYFLYRRVLLHTQQTQHANKRLMSEQQIRDQSDCRNVRNALGSEETKRERARSDQASDDRRPREADWLWMGLFELPSRTQSTSLWPPPTRLRRQRRRGREKWSVLLKLFRIIILLQKSKCHCQSLQFRLLCGCSINTTKKK